MLLFRINLTNNGNKTLSPVEVADALPESLSFVNSSLCAVVWGQNVSWSLPFLAVGQTCTIELFAEIRGGASIFLNKVRARGFHRGQWAEAEAFCSRADLPCSLETAPQKAFELRESHDPSTESS